ncbi:kelch domain-containing protein 7A [Dunckerocampus dactyliophorus]|uniref:kelch domain-containing protein 7A n=1 Tax=Dunckerocampus dactyliophorus TaxID=161453 RepID=UPI002406127A|nr:kelch domain-containing protein 7A [Dunckerocampus dactyliophorus]
MAIADLLGVQFDMQLLLKMSISVATMLLVSLAYRFYSSRYTEESPVQESKAPQTCQRCKTALQGTGTDDEQHGLLLADEPSSDSTREAEDYSTQELGNVAHCTQHIGKEAEISSFPNQALVASRDTSTGSSLDLPYPKKNGLASATGRRSPCFLKKLEGSTGVDRELRKDLEQHGVYSSFHSKAKVRVEDAKLVVDTPEDQIVRGKIYEYYVETSSHYTTDPNTLLDPDVTEESSSLGKQKLRSLQGSVPLRKKSYLAAAELSELSNPPPSSVGSTSTDPVAVSPSTNNTCLNVNNGSDLAAGLVSPLLHLSTKTPDFETLKSQLDLGNCLEALFFAKKHGQSSVEQAALRFMSDNYLQVLRDGNLYGRLTDAEREQLQRQRERGKRFIMVADMDPQDVSRKTRGMRRMSSAVYYYNDCVDAWQTLCPIPQEVISKACAMCTMDNYLFVAVECQGIKSEMSPSKRVFCYNPLTDIWKEISPMNEARPRCKLAALDGHVYAIGGECLSSVERYDPRSDRWTFVAPLPNDTFAVAHHVMVCNGELFVSGGSLRCMLLRYSPKMDIWRGSLLASGKDRIVDMVAVGPFVYRFEVNPLLGVSVYRYHTVARLWYECAAKRLLRCPAFQCVAMDDTIYCVSRDFTLKFEADEVSPAFTDDNFTVPPAAKGLLVPFVLSLPDKRPLQTSV